MMDNALGAPQTILLLGGTSEIGLAILSQVAGPHTRAVMLACRDRRAGEEAASALAQTCPTARIIVTEFDATAHGNHRTVIEEATSAMGDLDLVILAVGQLGDQELLEGDPVAAVALWDANATSAVSLGLATAARLRAQAHGTLVVLSSVAGERVRRSNFIYGASKAAMDAFSQGLADSLIGSGARVLIVRPGFVHTRMTAGMKPAPLAATPEQVAEAVAKGLRGKARIIWAPGPLRYVFMVLRHLPGPIWRRLPL
jgi:decaprenylphospho-beta-D-erythro-pentofuranosid-2-ulose 2-reductase